MKHNLSIALNPQAHPHHFNKLAHGRYFYSTLYTCYITGHTL